MMTPQHVGQSDESARFVGARKHQQGMALLISVFVLMMVGLISISALQNAEEEATAGGRTRRAARALYAADAGIRLAMTRLSQMPPNLVAINQNFGADKIVHCVDWLRLE